MTALADQLTYTGRLIAVHCHCQIRFAVPESMWDAIKASDDYWIWCPNGHKIHWAFNEDQQERWRVERLQRALANREEDVRAARASLITTKGHLTRTKRRADRGVCLHCKRSFANVERHVAHMHPAAVSS